MRRKTAMRRTTGGSYAYDDRHAMRRKIELPAASEGTPSCLPSPPGQLHEQRSERERSERMERGEKEARKRGRRRGRGEGEGEGERGED
eukprot:2721135-Rhodomonas_salina.1